MEASRQSRVCAGAANDIACMIFRVLMEVSVDSRHHFYMHDHAMNYLWLLSASAAQPEAAICLCCTACNRFVV